MKDKKKQESLWTVFYLITGACFFTFSKVVQFLEGTNLTVFTRIGLIALLLGSLNKIRISVARSK
jgi:hypothetical protein